MNSKLIIFVVCSLFGLTTSNPFFGINVQITGADYSAAATATTNMNNSLTVASSLLKPVPLSTAYLYKGNLDFLPFLEYITYFVSNVANATLVLNNVFKNVTKAAADNTNFPGVFTALQTAVNDALGFLGGDPYPWAPTIPDSIMTNIQVMIKEEMKNLSSLIEQTLKGIINFKSSGLALTSANVLKYIPNQVAFTTSLKNSGNYTGQFLISVTNITKNLNNTYNLIKMSEPTLISIEKQFNATLNSTIAIINKTEVDFNNTMIGFVKNVNATYTSFLSKIPAALKNNPGYMAGVAGVNEFFKQIVSIANSLKDALFTSLEEYKMTFYNSLIDAYYNQLIAMINDMRLDIISTTLGVSYNTYNCGLAAINALEAKFKAIGGPTALTNCTNLLDMQLFTRLNATLNVLLGLTYQDIVQASVLISKCLGTKNVTTSSTSPPPYPYSVLDCLSNIGGELTFLPSYISDTFATIGGLLINMGMQSTGRMNYCFLDNIDFLQSAFYPIYNNYLVCKAKSVPPV